MRKNSSAPRGYLYLKIFCIFIVLLTLIVGIFRGVALYRERSFLRSSYTTLYSNGEDHFLVSYHDPGSYVIAELVNTPNLSLERASRAQLSLALEVPVDAVVVDPSLASPDDIFSLSAAVRMMLFPHSYVLRDINGVDALKYFRLARAVSSDATFHEVVNYRDLEDGELSSLFQDREIFNNAVSVEVMNGTEVGGLGSAFAEVLLNRGYNVIAVTNTNDPYKNSFVHFNRAEDTETAASLLHLFSGSRREERLGQSADIVVVLGRDVAK